MAIRVLHFVPKDDPMIDLHVGMLCEGMGLEAENHTVNQADSAKTLLQGSHYDILHLHGCWRNSSRNIVSLAFRNGARLVVTPHGQLEPWVRERNYWSEKLPKRICYQRRIITQAYTVIIQGRMEQESMQELGWNTRTVIVRNAVITNSISKQQMARQTFAVYRKVMDSNPLELMTTETRSALRSIIKAGITGDVRWLSDKEKVSIVSQWRELLSYAHQEQIDKLLQRGARILGLVPPDIDVSKIDYFLPDGFQPADSIQQAIGNQFVSENERLLATFRYVRKLVANRQLAIKHLVELDRELRQHSCEEAELCDTLEEHHLLKPSARIMQLLGDLTGLTEGFMPMSPLNDRITRKIRIQTDNHLKVFN